MNTTHHDNQDLLIDRYLGGKLSPAEHAAFEIRLLDEPFLLEQVQIAEAMKAAMSREKSALLRPSRNSSGLRMNPLALFGTWLQQPLSMVATVLVAVLGWQVAHTRLAEAPAFESALNSEPAAVAHTASALAISSVVQLESSRSVATQHVSGAAPYLFKLDAGLGNEAGSYAFSLKDADQHAVFSQSGLKADAEGWVQLVIADKLHGEYVATLSWTDASGAAQQHAFTVTIE